SVYKRWRRASTRWSLSPGSVLACDAVVGASLPGVLSVFKDPASTDIYTLSLHDALPILFFLEMLCKDSLRNVSKLKSAVCFTGIDRKSTRLNSSHVSISYAVFCLKKKREDRPSRAAGRTSERPARRPPPGGPAGWWRAQH